MTSWDRLQPDAVIGGVYQIVRLLGRGGSGEVYEALHLRTGSSLAIKILRADFNGKSEALARFQREAEVTSRLHHPNIVKVFDFDCLPDGRPFLVMELLTGKDLGSILRSKQPLPPAQLLAIVDQVALALAATHGAGVVHRDLSPGNIFIEKLPGTDREMIRVLDFGISKVRDTVGALTHTTTIMGTPYYMSPEQAQGHAKVTDGRADQFALAAITYEMLTGRQAFASDDPSSHDPATAILYRVVHADPVSFASLGIDLPPALEAVVFRALAKDPAQRYPSIIDFSDALATTAWETGFGGQSADGVPAGRADGEHSGSSSYNPASPRRRRNNTAQVRATAPPVNVTTAPGTGTLRGLLPWYRTRRTAMALGAVILLGSAAAALVGRSDLQRKTAGAVKPSAGGPPPTPEPAPPATPPSIEPLPTGDLAERRLAPADERPPAEKVSRKDAVSNTKRKKSYHSSGTGRQHPARPRPHNEDIY